MQLMSICPLPITPPMYLASTAPNSSIHDHGEYGSWKRYQTLLDVINSLQTKIDSQLQPSALTYTLMNTLPESSVDYTHLCSL